jgi:hypothetical protein
MKIIVNAFVLAAIAVNCIGAESQNIPISQLGGEFRLVGKLHIPLGEVVTLKGVVVEGPFKGAEGGFNLRVQTIQGRPTQEDIQIPISPFFYKWGEKATVGGHALPDLKAGAAYEMEGYATGGYVGVPGEVFNRGAVIVQTPAHYFREEFVVTKAKAIKQITFSPDMFEGERALIQGKAKSQDGKSFLVGDGWKVVVATNTAWPEEIEGKKIETWGIYNPAPDRTIYELLDGEWRLVMLEDQIGRQVKLRGRARSLNGVWWFHYRGIDLYIENITSLPGWTDQNHWRPMEIRGRLGKAMLPRVDQVSLKLERDVKEYFIVRGAEWSPLPALLSPERPFDELE